MTSAHSRNRDQVPVVPSLPLSEEHDVAPADASIGTLAKDVTTHLSALVRAEVELAKTEIGKDIRDGAKGSAFFIVALTIVLFSLFFLFIAFGELLSEWLPRWAGFGIVFLAMLVAAGVAAGLGYRKVRRIRKPERTITTVRDTAAALRRPSRNGPANGPAAP